MSLPFEIWRAIFYQVIDENNDFANQDELHISQLGPSPYQGFSAAPVNYAEACSLALVCHLWHDLSEEIRYRHLRVSEIGSIERIRSLVVKPACNRIRTPSTLDPRHRTRGSWAHSLTIVIESEVPYGVARAHGFKFNQALQALIRCLPSIRKLVTVQSVETFPATRAVVTNTPISITRLAYVGPTADALLSLLPKQTCRQICVLSLERTDGVSNIVTSLDFPNLQWLSIPQDTFFVVNWNVPRLSFLSLILRLGHGTLNCESVLRMMGRNIQRLEFRTAGSSPRAVASNFLQWCPQLEMLLLDISRATVEYAAISNGDIEGSSLKHLVLVISEWSLTRPLGAAITPTDKTKGRLRDILQLTPILFPKLRTTTVSIPRDMAAASEDIWSEIQRGFQSRLPMDFEMVFF